MGHGVLRPVAGSGRSTRPAVTALVVGLTVAVALLALLVAGLLRAHADILRTLHDMGIKLGSESVGRERAEDPLADTDPTGGTTG